MTAYEAKGGKRKTTKRKGEKKEWSRASVSRSRSGGKYIVTGGSI